MQNFTRSVFHVFHHGKWNGLENDLADVTRHFKTFLEIYQSPLCIKAFWSYKRRTKHVENGTLSSFAYISRTLSRTEKTDTSLKRY